MKTIKYLSFIFVFFFIMIIPVHAASDYYEDITITFNHNGCDDQANKEVVIQLFADGKKVDGQEVTLNSTTGYTYTYEHLLIFKPDSPDQIRYEVKLLENGEYKLISPKNYSYETAEIKKWVQVLPEDIKPGHTYVITTDNWNYESNGFSKIIYLRGDITAKGAQVVPEFNIIDGKPSYYVIDGEPIENTKWTVSAVPEDDPNYEEFKDYLMFKNESEGKYLTLTGYNTADGINFIYKRSGKNGYVESEDAMYTNKVTLTDVEGSKGRFYIGTYNLYPEPNNMMQYITLSGQNQYQAGSNMERAAQFKAFEYVEKEVNVGITQNIEESLCEKDTVVLDTHTEYKRSINVDFNCENCEDKKDSGVVIQLFANDVKVDGEEVLLNNENGFTYEFKDLPIFDDHNHEIEYEVRALINGNYYLLPEKDISYEKKNINKWTQVLPSDIKPNHTYVIITENLNYESNGYSRYNYLRGDITAKGSQLNKEFNIINGKNLYYTLEGEPIENSKWICSAVPTDDPNYEEFKDYLMFKNESEGKFLTLTGYNTADGINFIYKRSGKDGYVESEDAMYTNKVNIIPTEDDQGTFYIGTKNLYPEPNNMMQYLSFSSQNQFQANPDISAAAKFIILEYTEEEVTVASTMSINPSLCEVLSLADEIEVPNTLKNINTRGIMLLVVIIASGIIGYVITNKKETQ